MNRRASNAIVVKEVYPIMMLKEREKDGSVWRLFVPKVKKRDDFFNVQIQFLNYKR